ncbi:MAG: hypothetical protein KatS3mg115_0217 [Candidatus Poribacteria bacterium]|nr:MAG: hypothetical protein KatS3mg115_0217 [Candidatus Poribacteria bacterium]
MAKPSFRWRSARGEWTVVVPRERVHQVLAFLRDDPKLEYKYLVDLTAVDYLKLDSVRQRYGGARYMVVYHLYSHLHQDDRTLNRIRIKTTGSGGGGGRPDGHRSVEGGQLGRTRGLRHVRHPV